MLAAVAIPASQAEIIQCIATIGDDMINVHGLARVYFASSTVFAAAIGALVYLPSQFTP
jgi:hypothetical protein